MGRAMYGLLALLVIAATPACTQNDSPRPVASGTTETRAATPSTPSPPPASPTFTKNCTQKNAVDLTQDDPYILVVQDFRFIPDCLIVRQSAAIAIENLDDVGHTFSIDGTVVQAPLIVHRTYTHFSDLVTFQPGVTYQFHCSIHHQMTGTLIVV